MGKIVTEAVSSNRRKGLATFEGDKVSITIDYSLCTNCGLCISNCPQGVLIWQEKIFSNNNHKIDTVQISDLSKCNGCKKCQEICKTKAISVK